MNESISRTHRIHGAATQPRETPSSESPPRRIALVAFDVPQDVRSPLTYARHLALALEAQGWEVHLFCNKPVPFPRAHLLQPGSAGASPVAQARALCAAAVEHIGRVSHEVGPFSAIHAIQWSSVPAALSMARHGETRSVVTFLDTVFSRRGTVSGSPEISQVRQLEQQAVSLSDVVLAGSEPVRQELAWLYGASSAACVAADAVDAPDSPAPVFVPPVRRLAFAGSWDAAGGADLFLETERLLVESDPAWRFVISEESVSRARLDADLRRRGQSAFLAHVDVAKTLAEGLAQGALVLVPARECTTNAPVFAAWRAGCPVIVARTGPHHEVEEGVNGRRAFPFAQSLANAVRDVASDTDRVRTWGAAGRRKLENQFTWPAVATMLEKVYREMTPAPTHSYV